jgi:transposase
MNPYPTEFRQKIIKVYIEEKPSIRQLALRFNVAKSFIQKLLKQYKETGDIAPKPQGGSPPRKLSEEQLVTLVEIVEVNNDATLIELCDLLEEATGVRVSCSTMGRIMKQLNYSVKKKLSMLRKKNGKRSNLNVESFESRFAISQHRS